MPRSIRWIARFTVSSLALVLCVSAVSYAQTPNTRGPDGSNRVSIPGIDIFPYPGMPFTGTFTTLRVVTLQDGSTVTTSVTNRVARDSQGRVFRERHHFAPVDTDPQKTLLNFYIFDPTTHTQIDCFVAAKRCIRGFYYRNLNFVEAKPGAYDQGRRVLTRDSLGEKTFGDLTAVGTRETVTIAPGTLGNDKQLTLTRDFWYSPDLKTNLEVIRSDPRQGTVTVTLTVQSRAEPDPSVFAVPDGYTLPPPRPVPTAGRQQQ